MRTLTPPPTYQIKATRKGQFLNFISLELLPASPRGWSLGTVSRIEVRQIQLLAPGSIGQLVQGVSRCKSPNAGTSGVAGSWPDSG